MKADPSSGLLWAVALIFAKIVVETE